MPSILEKAAAKQAKEHDTIRRAYLRMLSPQGDLRDIAEREIAALARLIAKLDAPPRRK